MDTPNITVEHFIHEDGRKRRIFSVDVGDLTSEAAAESIAIFKADIEKGNIK